MSTYLLTWTPQRWHWEDIQERVAEIQEEGYSQISWSCGRSKRIRKGDRLFMIRLGREPRGIFASGYATSNVYEGQHWDEGVSSDKLARYIDIRLGVLLNPDRESIFPRSALNEGVLKDMHWDSQSSGIEIREEIAIELETKWAGFLASKEINENKPEYVKRQRIETDGHFNTETREDAGQRETLEAQLHQEMLAIYQRVGRETGYWARRYLQRVRKVGGLQAAKDWLKPKSSPQSGLQKLAEVNQLELSVEALVLHPHWSSLFTTEELHVARKRLNIASSFRLSEEIFNEQKLVEGSVCQVNINSYERNPEARRCCIEHHGTSCCVCGFNFGEKFGTVAQGFIHVHHLKPLSEIQEEYEVDPITDLCPVCPNCHATIHLGGKTRSIEEVKSLLRC